MPTSPDAYRMLIVDDDPDVGDALQDFFELHNFDITRATDGTSALRLMQAEDHGFDVVMLDVTLPDMSGFDVLEAAQEFAFDAPVLMLTGRGETENVLKGLGLGADDYIVKPFNDDELLARVRAVLARTQPPDRTPMEVYTVGDVAINFSTHEASRNGDPIAFTALEYDILRYLILHRGKTVTRRQLLTDVWGIEQDIVTRTIDRHMASVRKKIEPDLAAPTYIETVYGIGYRFKD
ncbi:MAG: response regulator transcription factor [Bacteroidetes bacterium]|nr:response regulator transcription factor [Bacteroidota bacterium]